MTEPRQELDADALELLLSDLERESTELVAAGRGEPEAQLADARAAPDGAVRGGRRRGAAGAPVLLEQGDHVLLAELPLRPVGLVVRLEGLEDMALQHGQVLRRLDEARRDVERVADL